jgi:hypothetical protein
MARLLLDEHMPRLMISELAGHYATTVQQQRWSGLRNGVLLRTAAGAGFDVFITMDKSIPFQQVVKGLGIAVMVVRARSNRLEHLRPLVPAILDAVPTSRPGTVVFVGRD